MASLKEREFQFPSNGKVYLKSVKIIQKFMKIGFNSLQTGKCISRLKPITRQETETHVSIPFKRESVSQVPRHGHQRIRCPSFNSLQTGKCISSQSGISGSAGRVK